MFERENKPAAAEADTGDALFFVLIALKICAGSFLCVYVLEEVFYYYYTNKFVYFFFIILQVLI